MIVNGKEMNSPPGTTVSNLLSQLSLNRKNVLVAVNMVIVPKEKYSSTFLSLEDQVEIIGLVGGG